MPDRDTFFFVINFVREQGDPRRIFDAASRLIDGFAELDEIVGQSIDANLRTMVVLQDIQSGSLRVILRTMLADLDDEALREGEWKKAVGPLLVRAKYLAIQALDKPKPDAPKAIEDLRQDLMQGVSETDIKHLPAYGPIHEGRLIASLDKLQGAKRILLPSDTLSVQGPQGQVYDADLSHTWEPAELVTITNTTERHSEGVIILTIRKADLLGNSKWQFTHGTAPINASIKDERWLKRFHSGKVALHSGDAMRCKVRFTYIFDDNGTMIEHKIEIIKVSRIIKAAGAQKELFSI
jgi:hypothetical protein